MIVGAIFKRKSFDPMLAFANLVALHGDGKAPLSYAENSLLLAKTGNFTVKQVTGL